MTRKEFYDYMDEHGFKCDYDTDHYMKDLDNGNKLTVYYLDLPYDKYSIHALCTDGKTTYGCFRDTAEEAIRDAIKGMEPKIKE